MKVLHLSFKSGEYDYLIFSDEKKLMAWLAKWCFIHWSDDIEEPCTFKEGDEAIIKAYFEEHSNFDGDSATISGAEVDPVDPD